MINKALTLLSVLFISINTYSQANENDLNDFGNPPLLNWIGQFGGDSSDYVISITADSSGNIYTYAYSGTESTFFGEDIDEGIFLCKQNSLNEVLWLKQFVGTFGQYQIFGSRIAINPSNDLVYITGQFTGELIIPNEETILADTNGSVFIISYYLDGNFNSNIIEDIQLHQSLIHISVDEEDNVILTGTYSSTIVVNDSAITPQVGDAIVLKYSSNGELNWFIPITGDNISYLILSSIDIDNHIFLILEEYSTGTIEIGSEEITKEEGGGNILLIKMDEEGDIIWWKTLGTTGSFVQDSYNWPTGLICDNDTNVYIKGRHGDSSYFDEFLLTSQYPVDEFIAKLNSDGDVLWINSIKEANQISDYNQFSIDSEGNIYCGFDLVSDSVFFGDEYSYIPNSESDILITKYTDEGELEWVKAIIGDGLYSNDLNCVMALNNEKVYISGSFTGNISIEDSVLTSSSQNGFVALLGETTVGIKETFLRENKLKVYPNPSSGLINIQASRDEFEQIEILNANGKIVYSGKFSPKLELQFLPKGLYLLRVKNENYTSVRKLIIN